MLTTREQICNLALGMVGQKQLVDDLDTEQTAEAQACATFYEMARDECLAAAWWRFNGRRAVLALAADSNGDAIVRSGWDYVYTAPADMLVAGARYIDPGARFALYAPDERLPFEWEPNDTMTGYLILTDEPTASLVYSARCETVALWSANFQRAVAARLAVDLALMLPVKPELSRLLEPRAQLALVRAAAIDANSATPAQQSPESEIIRARG